MTADVPLVSIGLPVRNAADRISSAIESALGQDYPNVELVITDNDSSDDTEDVCRELASRDNRIKYHRNAENIGILRNFERAAHLASGRYIRWMSDDDTLAANCISRCAEEFTRDPRLVLVTSQLDYQHPDGTMLTEQYHGTALGSDSALERYTEMVRLLNEGAHVIDPLYGLFRRDAAVSLTRRKMLREDEVFATKVAIAGPWAHVNEILARRYWKHEKTTVLASRLEVPAWQAHFATTIQSLEMLRTVSDSNLDRADRNSARMAVARFYGRRQSIVLRRRIRKVGYLARQAMSRGSG